MWIAPSRTASGVLHLEAYTFRADEWIALEQTLTSVRIGIRFSPLGTDDFGREGRRYYVETEDRILALASILDGEFGPDGAFLPRRGTGATYACREVRRDGLAKGCEEFDAPNDHVAITKCGMIAKRQSWFGGHAERGRCGPNIRKISRLFRW